MNIVTLAIKTLSQQKVKFRLPEEVVVHAEVVMPRSRIVECSNFRSGSAGCRQLSNA
jgi:hypothetical protein